VKGKKITLHEIEVLTNDSHLIPGTFYLYDDKLAVQTGQDSIVIKQLQPEGKKTMSAESFLRGYRFIVGEQGV
ncbi:MAG: methionyl-tRNA formyltransferase, partial [Candidatus Komeilibacteria bacterium]|nr:methionyl-tRNA formyltransferase [Candidatus Komeilibacteria bacterium]